MYGVHKTFTETAAVSCRTSHASAVSTPLQWIFKKRAVKLVSHVEPHASAVSLLKRAENSAISAIINEQLCCIVPELCESRGGHPGLPVLTSLQVSVDVKIY